MNPLYDDDDSLADELMEAAEVDGLYDDVEDDDADEPNGAYRASTERDDVDLPPRSRADEIVDQLMPDGFEWRRLVCSYPRTAMLVAMAGGFVVGRAQGAGMLAGLSGFVLGEVSRNVQEFVEDFAA